MPKIPTLSPYQKHKRKWKDCDRCELCTHRNKVVIGSGKLPAPILFIGENPGLSEDVSGKPFHGPAGKLFRMMVENAIDGKHDYAMTNLIGCLPSEMKTSTGHVEPSEGSIRACTKRVKEFIRLVKPGLIFRVGKLTHKNLSEKEVGIKMVNLPHPANLIRLDVSQKTLAIQRCVIAIEDAVNEFLIPF